MRCKARKPQLSAMGLERETYGACWVPEPRSTPRSEARAALRWPVAWPSVIAASMPSAVRVGLPNRMARLTPIRGGLLIPCLALLTFLGAYTSSNSLNGIVVTLIFGWFGYLMVRSRWPRAPLVLGVVLGDVAERYLWISVARYGSAWLTRPIVVI